MRTQTTARLRSRSLPVRGGLAFVVVLPLVHAVVAEFAVWLSPTGAR